MSEKVTFNYWIRYYSKFTGNMIDRYFENIYQWRSYKLKHFIRNEEIVFMRKRKGI